LDQLQEATLPVEGEAPLGDGRLRLSATPTYLSAGTLHGDTTSQSAFGTGALGNRSAPGGQQAEGVGLDLGYRYKWVNADIGSTPLEFGVGDATFYAGGGYAAVDGTRVASNDEVEAGAGGSYPVWRQGRDELRLGLDLVYFSYDKNLRYFTLGQGGYFSPQSYVASLVPLTYTHADDELKWSLGASLGYQTYHENASPMFPNDPALESALASVPGAPTEFPGKNASGAVGGANGSIEYRLSPSLSIGARAGYQHAGDWSEFSGLLFARYSFKGETR
jgi:hypothetical protein